MCASATKRPRSRNSSSRLSAGRPPSVGPNRWCGPQPLRTRPLSVAQGRLQPPGRGGREQTGATLPAHSPLFSSEPSRGSRRLSSRGCRRTFSVTYRERPTEVLVCPLPPEPAATLRGPALLPARRGGQASSRLDSHPRPIPGQESGGRPFHDLQTPHPGALGLHRACGRGPLGSLFSPTPEPRPRVCPSVHGDAAAGLGAPLDSAAPDSLPSGVVRRRASLHAQCYGPPPKPTL